MKCLPPSTMARCSGFFQDSSKSPQDIFLPVTVSAPGGILLNPRHLILCSAKPFHTWNLHHHPGSTYALFFKWSLVLVSMLAHPSFSFYFLVFFLGLWCQLHIWHPIIKCQCSWKSCPRPSTLCCLYFALRKYQFPWTSVVYTLTNPKSLAQVTLLSNWLNMEHASHYGMDVSKTSSSHSVIPRLNTLMSLSYLSLWLHYSSSYKVINPSLMLDSHFPFIPPVQPIKFLDIIYIVIIQHRVALATDASILVPENGYISLMVYLLPNMELKEDCHICDKLFPSDGSSLPDAPAVTSIAGDMQFLALTPTPSISLSQMYEAWNSAYCDLYPDFIFWASIPVFWTVSFFFFFFLI